jgi:hypothetical protein
MPVTRFVSRLYWPKLQHPQRDGGVKAKPTLVRADGVIKLDAPRAIDAESPFVVFPRDPENDDAIGLGYALQDVLLLVSCVLQHDRHQ